MTLQGVFCERPECWVEGGCEGQDVGVGKRAGPRGRNLCLCSVWPWEWQVRRHLGREARFRISTLGSWVLRHGPWMWKYSEVLKLWGKTQKGFLPEGEKKNLSVCLLLLSHVQWKPTKDLREKTLFSFFSGHFISSHHRQSGSWGTLWKGLGYGSP